MKAIEYLKYVFENEIEDFKESRNIYSDEDIKQFLIKIAEENSYIVDYPCSRGFIFNDGSILDISPGRDHRIIDIEIWTKENIITYNINDDFSFNVRINNFLTKSQIKILLKLDSFLNISLIYFDIYKNEELKHSGQTHSFSSLISIYEKIYENEETKNKIDYNLDY